MVDSLEYTDISSENKGHMSSGRLKMTDQSIIFKNSKTGKVDQLNSNDITMVNFQRFVDTFGLRVFTKNGTLHRFIGFKSGDETKLAEFFKKNYSIDMLEKELSLRGWNWGTAHFNGAVLSFDCDRKTSFEVPLQNVSQCTTGKNEVTLEFHQNDDTPVSLVEMRFHIPSTESADIDPVDAFYQNVVKQASVLSVSGDAIAIFREIQCLTPRGRYDIKMFQSFFQLHGKTFDYKIPMSTVLRLFLLPHKDNRQTFFILSLDPPIKQGQTRYHYLVLLFGNEEETSIELPFSDDELKAKYDDKLTKELSGPVYEVIGKIMKALINRKLTGPGNFVGHSGTPAIGCSYKATAGYLYPLERGFVYVHKPPMHIRFEEISSVNFARSGGSTRSFDFEIELKSSAVHTFSSIEKEEYTTLFNYITSKKIHVKNTGKNDKAVYTDDFGDSDNEAEPDAYLARVKAEGQERDSDDADGDSDESTDDDFNPDAEKVEDVADEYDSDVQTTSESDDSDDSSGRGKKKQKKEKKKKVRKEKSTKSRGKKKNKDDDKPKGATTAYMLWFNETRDQIRKDNPNLKITEISKKAGEMWREMKDKSIWEEKAAKDRERYNNEMKNYKPSGDDSGGNKRKKETLSPKKASSVTMAGSGFKSKEYISDDDSSGSDDDKKKKKKKNESASENDDEEEEEEEDEESDDGSASD